MYALIPEYFDCNHSIIQDIMNTESLHGLKTQQGYLIEGKSMKACYTPRSGSL